MPLCDAWTYDNNAAIAANPDSRGRGRNMPAMIPRLCLRVIIPTRGATMCDEREVWIAVEQLHGFVDAVRDGVAYVTLTGADGEELWGEYPYAELQRFGVGERRQFICKAVVCGDRYELRFEPVIVPLSEQELDAIAARVEELFPDGDLDDDE